MRRTPLLYRIARVELRIGINLGVIVVDGEAIYGDGVNVAARLEVPLCMGINPQTAQLTDPAGRPQYLLEKRKPIAELV